MNRLAPLVIAALLAAPGLAAAAQNQETKDELRGPAFVQPVSCVETRFLSITDRFGKAVGDAGNDPTTGMDVTFTNHVTLVAYTVSDVALKERPGDRVQLCFLGHVEGTQACAPATDTRGRLYRVYDFRLHAAWTAMNSQHACGGA